MLKSFPKCYLFTGPWKPGWEAGGAAAGGGGGGGAAGPPPPPPRTDFC